MLAQFPEAAQNDIFGRQPYVIAPAAISPNGRAQVRDGGYLLSGRWQWGTGVMHADWILLAGIVEGSGEMRMFILPRDEVEIIDTWQVDGMAGTGSNDMQVRDVFVPARRRPPRGNEPATRAAPLGRLYRVRTPRDPRSRNAQRRRGGDKNNQRFRGLTLGRSSMVMAARDLAAI